MLADEYGNTIHLFERDCSIQRRYQKVVEFAPALGLPEHVRSALHNDAIRIAKSVKYANAGTVEFLVDNDFNHYFLEVDNSLKAVCFFVNSPHRLPGQSPNSSRAVRYIGSFAKFLTKFVCVCVRQHGDGGDHRHRHRERADRHCRWRSTRGAESSAGPDCIPWVFYPSTTPFLLFLPVFLDTSAFKQLRVTTEDSSANFQPDSGYLEVYRSSGGIGVRQDSACSTGSVITGHYDSLLVKLIATGLTYAHQNAHCVYYCVLTLR